MCRMTKQRIGYFETQQRFLFVLRYMLPCGHISRFERIAQPVIISAEDDGIIFPEETALLPADVLLILRQLRRVQLISEGSAHGNHRLCPERHEFSAVGDMGPHGGNGVYKGCPVMQL